MPFMLAMAVIVLSLAMIIPQREPGSPSFERLIHRIILGVPQRARLAKDNARKRYTVSVINHQWDVVLIRQSVQLHQLFVGDNVTGWVGRARDANHPRFFADVQMLKIDVILKLAFRQQLNIRARRNEEVVFQTRESA